MRTVLCCLCLLAVLSPVPLLAEASSDWEQIVALDAGPKASINSPEQLKSATLQHLERQEKVLRGFLASYPADTHTFSVYLRLAHLLAVRSELKGSGKDWEESMKVLDNLETRSAPESRCDVDFARISLSMQRLKPGDSNGDEGLLQKMREFQEKYPQDRRNGRLLVEIATLYDEQPAKKEALLQQAKLLASDPPTQNRITDDLKRLALLDKPLELQFVSRQGKPVNLKDYRGKVVFVVFFAEWSAPSLKAAEGVQAALKNIPQARALGISLDQSADKLAALVKSRGLDWPVYFDGKGWNSPLARGFGINSLPTVWLVDRDGILRRLNVRDDWEEAVRRAQ
jgi:peroxiredoxin